jgi:hypothetical protein
LRPSPGGVAGRDPPAGAGQPSTITQLTFDRGVIRTARFTRRETIVYGARWGSGP